MTLLHIYEWMNEFNCLSLTPVDDFGGHQGTHYYIKRLIRNLPVLLYIG
jgi:hypothetical protein